MTARAKFFVFKPVAVVAMIVATALTILLPLLQGVAWVNENAVWAVWVALLVLTVAAVLLHARLMAVKKMLTDARADATSEKKTRAENAETRAAEAETRADREVRKAAEAVESSNAATEARMGESDRAFADELNDYASNSTVLNELADFFPYKIPRELVNAVRERGRVSRLVSSSLSSHSKTRNRGVLHGRPIGTAGPSSR